MRRTWRRSRAEPVDELVDLRTDATIDLRPDAVAASAEYHCMRIHSNVPPTRDAAAAEWEQAGSLVSYPADLEEWLADRRREDLQPGHPSATVFETDEIEAP